MSWRPLRLVLVLLALFGLVGQTAVYAMAPLATPVAAAAEIAPPSMDCESMATSDDASGMPCEGITLDCIAEMGCVTPPAVSPSAELSTLPVIYARVAYPAPRQTSSGRSLRPELFPPIA